ncbi:hypothetical protein IDJ77_13470 [Mucilaginibacter sp. ZT4R22]|uniref:Uncharacterized protein n=1 Tax=Mucilaginibacter pankratovii TaxID=2772110 RepID=A0ABR7WR92_9SPHI|nr:hypothetical protein [Mucilaginibacter pankratovii]MBD1364825.1 hypothetical protein [Mucilaginibacter pankratovii]
MSIFRIFDFFRLNTDAAKQEADTATLWEDDYLQVEIIPSDNLAFLQQQLKIYSAFGEAHRTEEGFYTDIMARQSNPVPTTDKEFRADTLENILSGHGMPKYRRVEYGNDYFFEQKEVKTKAYGFKSFTLFFDVKGEFIENIWINIKQITSPAQLKIITSTLYDLGESYNLLLVDWNTDELIDLKDKRQISAYLR